jgi:hypothetical protein
VRDRTDRVAASASSPPPLHATRQPPRSHVHAERMHYPAEATG